MQVTRTTQWISGQVLTASALNTEVNNLLNAPSIVNADISGSAAIAATKILFGGSNGQFVKSDGAGGLTYASTAAVNRAFGFSSPGVQVVANDVSWDPTVPEAMTAVKLWAYCKTAPTGASLTVQVYDITQTRVVASVSITAGTTSANTTSMTNAALTAGDVLRMDVTAIGSGVAGSDVSIVLETTQP
jgi:hypothetical protein